jgi:DUF1365 family protein
MLPSPSLCIGQVMHRRLRPVEHAFTYSVFSIVLSIRRLAEAQNAIFSIDRHNLLSFWQKDHGPRDGSPLLPWIERTLHEHHLCADGEILLQTFPRVSGFVFNPVSFWYCYNHAAQLIAVLAEVNNTFGGQHQYLLQNTQTAVIGEGDPLHASKVFHVSPFNQIEGHYSFRFHLHDAGLKTHIDYFDNNGLLLMTAMSGALHRWSVRKLLSTLMRMPLLTAGIVVRIYWQAIRLWLKKVPFHGARGIPSPPAKNRPHPK